MGPPELCCRLFAPRRICCSRLIKSIALKCLAHQSQRFVAVAPLCDLAETNLTKALRVVSKPEEMNYSLGVVAIDSCVLREIVDAERKALEDVDLDNSNCAIGFGIVRCDQPDWRRANLLRDPYAVDRTLFYLERQPSQARKHPAPIRLLGKLPCNTVELLLGRLESGLWISRDTIAHDIRPQQRERLGPTVPPWL